MFHNGLAGPVSWLHYLPHHTVQELSFNHEAFNGNGKMLEVDEEMGTTNSPISDDASTAVPYPYLKPHHHFVILTKPSQQYHSQTLKSAGDCMNFLGVHPCNTGGSFLWGLTWE